MNINITPLLVSLRSSNILEINMKENNEEFVEESNHKFKFLLKIKKLFQAKPKTTEDMVAIVEAASEDDVIDEDAQRMIAGALEVSAMHTSDIMIPRTQMNV